eukprot:gnl/TRDRNA2_/TRDRNA2_61273_c0_seq1.p1 gnl/TRDRNA2_/TRDRNA2_61273_c0~~gnl/TRDRNA2_/TRDRNA2_61273_c0_seq1.p1  ORF type:complete len:175 (-),score=12.33 gnl/TRDRNA2_/TRDRNA2_61273_c0_seq1:155-679(-)
MLKDMVSDTDVHMRILAVQTIAKQTQSWSQSLMRCLSSRASDTQLEVLQELVSAFEKLLREANLGNADTSYVRKLLSMHHSRLERFRQRFPEGGISFSIDVPAFVQGMLSGMQEFRIGTSVQIHGLRNAKELNGQTGEIVCYVEATSRYGVRLHATAQEKSVKAENLVRYNSST